MTYVGKENDEDVRVPELKLKIEDENGDYVKLPRWEDSEPEDLNLLSEEPSTPRIKCGFFCKWVKFLLLFTFIGVVAFVFFKWILPFLMDKEVIPIINWERSTFSTPVLAVLLFVTVAIFPTILLPSSPSMWVAGMTFGYGYGFLLIISAVALGVCLPYLIGSLFYHKIQEWLEKYPKNASIIRLAGDGDWFHQFQAVVLIRVSPFPYIIYNYCAVATNVKFGPYFLGSIVGMVPDVFVAIYTGILIKTLADASHEQHSLSAEQIIFNILGFAAAAATTIICTVYAKRRLKRLQMEEELLLQ
ncbi:hypothetical protein Nepgr_011311 [Nepenthes gracilis]|uniref:VTT domain-containing protein n=1 Tax=Nepenthes gracilis TaxID=150966 RepID=A0AAD3SDU7_NEPGR|nr:hypothetical protein Nepgr_011311 [Nepenthes gracilis]